MLLKNIPIAQKLPAVFVLLTIITATAIGLLSYNSVRGSVETKAESLLHAALNSRTEAMQAAVTGIHDNLELLGEDYGMASMLTSMTGAYRLIAADGQDPSSTLRGFYINQNPNAADERYRLFRAENDTSPYSALHSRWHAWVTRIVQHNGYRDMFLLDTQGNFIYSWAKGEEFGSNIFSGPLAGSPFSEVIRTSLDHGRQVGKPYVFASIFGEYQYADGLFSLKATPVFDADGTVLGAVAVRVPITKFSPILGTDMGMGYPVNVSLTDPNGNSLVTFVNGEYDPSISADPSMADKAPEAMNGETEIFTAQNGVRELAAYGALPVAAGTYGIVLEAKYADVMAMSTTLRRNIIIVALITAVIVAGIGVMFSRGLVAPLAEMRSALARVSAERDLTDRIGISSSDEVGASSQAMDEILDVMDGAISQIRSSTEQVTEVAMNMSESAQAMASNAEIQSSAVEELSSSVEETSHQVKSSAQSAETVDKLVKGTSEVAAAGKAKVNQMVTAMNDINASSEDIAKIIKVIDEIAFQTNLLALNAAVEAARAGQHGRGFAVVAQEVRNLASRSAKAARETSQLIESSSQRVSAGVAISDETSKAFEQIANDIARAAELVGDITRAAGEQSRGVDLINDAINDIARIARESNAQAENIATTANELSGTNEILREQVGYFRSSNSGSVGRSKPSRGVSAAEQVTRGESGAVYRPSEANQNLAPVTGAYDDDARGFGNF